MILTSKNLSTKKSGKIKPEITFGHRGIIKSWLVTVSEDQFSVEKCNRHNLKIENYSTLIISNLLSQH